MCLSSWKEGGKDLVLTNSGGRGCVATEHDTAMIPESDLDSRIQEFCRSHEIANNDSLSRTSGKKAPCWHLTVVQWGKRLGELSHMDRQRVSEVLSSKEFLCLTLLCYKEHHTHSLLHFLCEIWEDWGSLSFSIIFSQLLSLAKVGLLIGRAVFFSSLHHRKQFSTC